MSAWIPGLSRFPDLSSFTDAMRSPVDVVAAIWPFASRRDLAELRTRIGRLERRIADHERSHSTVRPDRESAMSA